MNSDVKNLTMPTIHLNGTSAERLLEALEEAYSALTDAISKVAETAPNGRDYYPQGSGALHWAQDEHTMRMLSLTNTKEELGRIAEHISAEQLRRQGRTS